ncbi:MAG: adenylate kinase [Nitrospinota bacterium]|nr:adenylate kinase [Nitrospinota bacterium]
MKIILLGAPGSGKGTQGAIISEKNQIPRISTGDMLRRAVQEKTSLGKKVEQVMYEGRLVSDQLIIELMKERLSEDDCKDGYILDGFPRNLAQGKALEKEISGSVDIALLLDVSNEEVVSRLSGRLTCKDCSAVFPNSTKTSKCSNCSGENLYVREDDLEQTVVKRLEVYQESTSPLVEFYSGTGKLLKVDGIGATDEITKRVLEALSEVWI